MITQYFSDRLFRNCLQAECEAPERSTISRKTAVVICEHIESSPPYHDITVLPKPDFQGENDPEGTTVRSVTIGQLIEVTTLIFKRGAGKVASMRLVIFGRCPLPWRVDEEKRKKQTSISRYK